jgi:hypothetical protein
MRRNTASVRASASLGSDMTTPDIDSEDNRERTQARFYATLGYAVQSWAFLEFTIGDWFYASFAGSDRNYHQIRAAFHSPRSFSGSLELLDAAFSEATHLQEYATLFKSLRKKIHTYLGFRNQIIHGITSYHVNIDQCYVLPLEDLMKSFSESQRHYGLEDLKAAVNNFAALGELWARTRPEMQGAPNARPDALEPKEALPLVLQLPAEAFSNQPTPLKPERRQRS